jgi:hypothetical protein
MFDAKKCSYVKWMMLDGKRCIQKMHLQQLQEWSLLSDISIDKCIVEALIGKKRNVAFVVFDLCPELVRLVLLFTVQPKPHTAAHT